MSAINLTQGNVPLLTAALYDAAGNVVDLTGCTVAFAFQGAALNFTHAAGVVGDPTQGNVSYQFAGSETATPGNYIGQWRVTDGGGAVTLYPLPSGNSSEGYLCFLIIEALPRATPSNIIYLRQMFEPVRSVLGDVSSRGRRYTDDAIQSVLRTCLMAGMVPGQALSGDRLGITPGIVLPSDMALLMYKAAKMFVGPNSAEYSYKTRALSEKFGRSDFYFFDLENAIYELENGAMFSSFQSFYAWVNSLSGVDIWSVMTDMTVSAPVATVNVGRAGVTVTTS